MTFNVFSITGNPVFDYFFSIVFIFGLVSMGPYMLFKLLRP